MSRLTRDIFINKTCELINEPGSKDVNLNQILNHCSANKGSFYHFFPQGKDELIIEAVKHQAECAIRDMHYCLDNTPSTSEGISKLLLKLATYMDNANYTFCMPFSAIPVIAGASNENIRYACEQALTDLASLVFHQLKKDGIAPQKAKNLSWHIASTVDGALLLSRTLLSSHPLRHAAATINDII